MASSAEQIRAYQGPALFSYGFRPFFLFGAAWAALAVGLWLPMLSGDLVLPISMAPIEWHVHELIFGYVPAVMAGFLLTAVPNWTGRLPVVGTPLMVLFATWAAGRIAMLTSAYLGVFVAVSVDMAFLALLGAIIAREIIAGKNRNNLKVLVLVALLFAANGYFHFEAITGGTERIGERLGIGATILLIMLIGGRIVPSFTRNWLARRAPGRLPVTFDRIDAAVLAVSIAAMASWVALPASTVTAWLSLIAMLSNGYRLSRWAGERTIAEPLVFILHLAYAFVPVGFGLLALSILRPDLLAPSGAVHGWTAGAVGIMTLAVMTRASLGHAGKPLTATRPIQAIYLAALLAALARILAAFDIAREPMLAVATLAWIAAFGGFFVVYAPLLARRQAR